MTFDFRARTGQRCDAAKWISEWEPEYPTNAYDTKYYDQLIQRAGNLSSDDFILMGRWKDSAWTDNRWKPNVAMVAYPAWIDASKELPGIVIAGPSELAAFLNRWADYKYPDISSRSSDGQKRFGVSRTTTIAHFISSGNLPICDSRVRTAIKRLCGIPTPDEVRWYLNVFVPIVEELRTICGASTRTIDKALFAFGASAR